MNIQSFRCDKHPGSELCRAQIRFLLDDTENTIETGCCIVPSCNRHYARLHGYFPFVPGGPPIEIAWEQGMHYCKSHDLFMAVTELEDKVVWACPEPSCTKTERFEKQDR